MRAKPYIEGTNTRQFTYLPDCLDDVISLENPICVVEAFVESLDLQAHSFVRAVPAVTGKPAYHPGHLLKLYLYGYTNKIRSSRKLEQEARRNIELWWLLDRLTPDHNTIADFRKDNAKALREVFRTFVNLACTRGCCPPVTKGALSG